MYSAFGIIFSSGNHIWVDGLQQYRPIGAFSFLGRYRVIDFPISNMSNSDIDRIQVYVRNNPRSIIEHLDVITTSTPNVENCRFFLQRTVLKMISTIPISQDLLRTWKASKR